MPIGSPNAGYKTFNTGDVLTAAQVQYHLQNQTIMTFATAAARDAALTAPIRQEGMFAYLADTDSVTFYNGTAWEVFGDQTLATLTSPKEVNTTAAGPATGTVNLDVVTSSILIYTSDATADWTLNVRGNSTTTLDSIMATGEQISVVFETPIGATAYEPVAGGFTIDGVVPSSIKYLGGSIPVGNINSTDVYVYTIRKTGTATFTVLGSQNKFA
jgi:hypothetical protein